MLLDEYTRINALYYPFSLCTNEIALKRFLLLFDTIGFIYPASSGFALTHFDYMQAVGRVSRRSPTTPILSMSYRDVIGANLDIEKWKDIIVALEKEGIIVAIDPKPLVDQNDTLITYATLADSQNSEFQALMNKALTSEFAKEFGDSYPQGGNYRNMVEITGSVDYALGWRLGMRGIPLTLKKIWFNEREKMLESYQGYGSLELKNMPTDLNDEGLYYFRATQAASFALNRALVASIQLGTPLVTDNQYFQDAISQKIKNILKFIDESENRKDALQIMNYVNDLKISVARFGKIESERLINLILQNIIEDEALQKISIEKLLAYKKKSTLERESMLTSVYQWAYEIEELIEAGKNDVEYISEKIYRTKVLPEVNKYREALRKLDRRLVPTILGSTAEGLGISLTATTISSLLAGLKLEQALILGIAIAAPSIGKSIKQILDFRVDRTEKQVESPLAYLLRVK